MRFRRVLLTVTIIGICLFSFTVISAGSRPPEWVPDPVKYLVYDVRLWVATPTKKVKSILNGALSDDRIYIDNYEQELSFQNGNLEIVGTLYTPVKPDNSPGIVLLHGSTPEGRKLGLYRILSNGLAESGYFVLSIDMRGYGDSSDPVRLHDPLAFDFADDAIQAIHYLSRLKDIDTNRLFIIGHSSGAPVAIQAGIEELRISKIVAIGPPRRINQRVQDEKDYFRRRTMRYMRLPEPIPADVFDDVFLLKNVESYLDYFSQDDHKPILLIDGELEGEDDRMYLESIYEVISEPKDYHTLSEADHYANVANFGKIIFFDAPVVEELVTVIDVWLDSGNDLRY